jgi:hypothetical protein
MAASGPCKKYPSNSRGIWSSAADSCADDVAEYQEVTGRPGVPDRTSVRKALDIDSAGPRILNMKVTFIFIIVADDRRS